VLCGSQNIVINGKVGLICIDISLFPPLVSCLFVMIPVVNHELSHPNLKTNSYQAPEGL